MEELGWMEIAFAVGALLLPFAFVLLRKFVKSTDTKIDDKVLAAVEKALAESKEEK